MFAIAVFHLWPAGVMSFPVFEASARRTVENWARAADGGNSTDGAMPGQLPPELSRYSPDQVKLICLSQVGVV
jgi:hypothetical protein